MSIVIDLIFFEEFKNLDNNIVKIYVFFNNIDK